MSDAAAATEDPGNGRRALAALDLGSNSFHLVVADVEGGGLRIVDRLKEPVRLASGLRKRGRLAAGARRRALETLGRFGERLGALPQHAVRAVGTATFRRAGRSAGFLEGAQEALGHPIDVISGQEEARLIWLGVSHDIEPTRGRRLVVDIGGASTEVMLGRDGTLEQAESLRMGCVRFTRRFFGKNRITPKSWRKAVTEARLRLEPIKRALRGHGFDHALGASGTVRAASRHAQELGAARTGLTRDALDAIRDALLAAGSPADLASRTLAADRRRVYPGGVAILEALFRDLRVERMQIADGALREGVLMDLVGRVRHEDVRDETVRRFMARFGVDGEQAARVEATALGLLEQVFADWRLKGAESTAMLRWSSRLHEAGMSVSHAGHHKHGAYLLTNADMPGFARGDQALLAALVRSHRRRLDHRAFRGLPFRHQQAALRLAVLLRLAARLHRSRASRALPPITAKAEGAGLALSFPTGWLDEHALTRADLAHEATRLDAAGVPLAFA